MLWNAAALAAQAAAAVAAAATAAAAAPAQQADPDVTQRRLGIFKKELKGIQISDLRSEFTKKEESMKMPHECAPNESPLPVCVYSVLRVSCLSFLIYRKPTQTSTFVIAPTPLIRRCQGSA